MLYQKLLRPLLFRFDPESVHHFAMLALRAGSPFRKFWRPFFSEDYPLLKQTLWDIDFPNPVGLAAGFDKNAEALNAWPALGFGFTELGTLTSLKQPGNEKPRIFRLVQDHALVNRCGFNNDGAEEAAQRLKPFFRREKPFAVPVGINIGKSKITPLEEAPDDYRRSFEALWPYADYFAVNVSSPNTPDLRLLQEKQSLVRILSVLNSANRSLAQNANQPPRPVLVKIAPDLSHHQVDDILDGIDASAAAGIIVCNTTVSRDFDLRSDSSVIHQTGGLSGRPLKERSTALIRYVYQHTDGRMPIIGVGGIETGDDAYEKIKAGASLVQVYTGFIYQGPLICRRINQRLIQLIRQDGLKYLYEAVGAENKKPSAG